MANKKIENTENEKLVSVVSVIKIDVEEFTAKHRPGPKK